MLQAISLPLKPGCAPFLRLPVTAQDYPQVPRGCSPFRSLHYLRLSLDLSHGLRRVPVCHRQFTSNTGPLCSAGSGCPSVPHLHRSIWDHTTPLRMRLRFRSVSSLPLNGPAPSRVLVLCGGLAPTTGRTRTRARGASEGGHRASSSPVSLRQGTQGSHRLLGHPLRAHHNPLPRRSLFGSPYRLRGCCFPVLRNLEHRDNQHFGAVPSAVHSLVCLRINRPVAGIAAKLTTGLLVRL